MSARFSIGHQGAVARLALTNPPGNLLDVPFMKELAAAVRGLAARPLAERPRLLLLASEAPGQFSQGIDPRAVVDADMAGRKAVFLALADLVEALWFSYLPILADISGPALAGGAVLAVLADFAIIDSTHGKISFSEAKVGLPLPLFIQRLIQRKVATPFLNEVILLGKNVDAAEACRIGLANSMYASPAERDEALKSYVGKITRLPPAVLSETLRQSRAGEADAVQRFRGDLGGFADFLSDDYLGKGLRAVLAGEAPKF